jgi:hypothetical protein
VVKAVEVRVLFWAPPQADLGISIRIWRICRIADGCLDTKGQIQIGYRNASLATEGTGAFKARKVISVDVRSAPARLCGQRWEVIFATVGTRPAEAEATHAPALVERALPARHFH